MPTLELSDRALNRATLHRQFLLERADLPVLDAVTHLIGLQAQVPLNPYLALWSRLARFDPHALGALLEQRAVVRIVVIRGTIHLVTVDDACELRPLAQPVLDGEIVRHGEFGAALRGLDLAPVLAFARPFVEAQPRSQKELRAALAKAFPDVDPGATALACRNHLAFVQVPPRGVWGRAGQVTSTTLEAWTGRAPSTNPSVDDVILRYLAAFGPATPADATTWSRITGMREIFERLRPQLVTVRDDRGRELFDLPDAPRPDPDTPAPPRFLPEYDNVLLSHADRTRFVTEGTRRSLWDPELRVHGTVLVDGFARLTWRAEVDARAATVRLALHDVDPLPKRALSSVQAEGRRMIAFHYPDATLTDIEMHHRDA